MFKAVVFDLDGTLLDSQLCFESIRRELEIPPGNYILEYLETLEESEKEEKMKRLELIEIQATESSSLFEGAFDLLETLATQDIKTGIFTRNCRAVVDHVVKKYQLPVTASISREEALPKPHPEGLLRLLSEWKIEPNELLFVGDSFFDIECGKNAGVKTALFGTSDSENTSVQKADFILGNSLAKITSLSAEE